MKNLMSTLQVEMLPDALLGITFLVGFTATLCLVASRLGLIDVKNEGVLFGMALSWAPWVLILLLREM